MTSIFYRKVFRFDVPFLQGNKICKDPRHAKYGTYAICCQRSYSPACLSTQSGQEMHTEEDTQEMPLNLACFFFIAESIAPEQTAQAGLELHWPHMP